MRFTSKIHNTADLMEMLGVEDVVWEEGKARDGWLYHEYFGGMHIYHGGREDVGVEFSGSGCRMLESCNDNAFDWVGLFRYIVDQGSDMNISRLDVAGDDHDGVLTMDKLYRHTQQRKYICKARRCVWMAGDEQSIVFGATSSDTRLRIYNKALERGVDGSWIRCEFQLRDKAADSFILNWLQRGGQIGETYGGVLLNYLRYVTSCPMDCQNNYDRLRTTAWWSEFVATSEKIKNITVGGLEYNYGNLADFIEGQCAGALRAYVAVNGGSVDKLLEVISKAQIGKKHKILLREMGVKI